MKEFLRNIREFINKNNFSPSLLKEKLEKYNLEGFEQELEKNLKLKNFLLKPFKDLPDNYKYLFNSADRKNFENYNLLQVMESTILFSTDFEMFISRDGEERPLGWLAYLSANGMISNIKMFAFNNSKAENITFMKDVKKRFLELCEKNNHIEWTADINNPFTKHYIRAILLYRGRIFKEPEDNLRFIIRKNDPCIDYSYLENIFDPELLRRVKI